MAETTPGANRRSSSRRKPKGSSKLSCITGKMGFGPNVAVSLLDVSETGIRMILKTALPTGHEVVVGLEAIGDRKPTLVPAQVVWCASLADGNYCIGAHFTKPMPYALLQSLAYM